MPSLFMNTAAADGKRFFRYYRERIRNISGAVIGLNQSEAEVEKQKRLFEEENQEDVVLLTDKAKL